MPDDDPAQVFTEFVREIEPRLRQSLVAALGGEAGREATAEALAWAWEHWSRVEGMDNPGGYLYRLGRHHATTIMRRRPVFSSPPEPSGDGLWVEPGLPAALAHLSEMQRVVVMLIHGYGWTYREAAVHLGVGISTVQTHTERGMAKLRRELKVETHA